jgi:transposase
MRRRRRPYSAEFRRRLVGLVRGRQTPEDLARKFEPSAKAIRNWVVQTARDESCRADGLTTDEKEEVRRLRWEVRVLGEEREILRNGPTCHARNWRCAMLGAPRKSWPSASWFRREPVPKHGPGAACALAGPCSTSSKDGTTPCVATRRSGTSRPTL